MRDEVGQLRADADKHEQRARDLEKDAVHPDRDEGEMSSLNHSARDARNDAHNLNARADALVSEYGIGEAEEAEKTQERRAWVLPGTVAEDNLQSLQEAKDGPSLFDQLGTYAMRGIATERDGVGITAAKAAVGKVAEVGAQAGKAIGNAINTNDSANDKAAALVRQHQGDPPDKAPAPAKEQGRER